MYKYVNSSVCEDFTIKGNRFFRADSRALFDVITDLAKENKTIYS